MSRQFWLITASCASLVMAPAAARAQHEGHHPGAASDSAAIVAVVGKYHAALAAGDSVAALALLADDVVILESGGVETREEYRSHHLPGDIRFAMASKSQRGPVRVRISGDVAWASSTSTTERTVNGNAATSMGAELMVLVRMGEEWKIAAIHWSSRARRPG